MSSVKTDESKIIDLIDHAIKEKQEKPKIYLKIFQFFKLYVNNLFEKIIGIISIMIGTYLILNFRGQIINLGLGLILIGISFLLLTLKIVKPQKNITIRLLESDRIPFFFSLWIFISLIITYQSDFRLLIVIIMIGFLIIKEITKSYVSKELNKKMKIFLLAFFSSYLLIVIEKVAAFLSQVK